MVGLDKQINYWAHMLDESFGDQSNVPQYTGKMVGYKWLLCIESNITEGQSLHTFDDENSAIQAGIDMIRDSDVDCSWCDPNTEKYFQSNEDAIAYFRKNKCISCSDGNSFSDAMSVKRIRTSDMPKLLELVYANASGYDIPIEFDGNNIKAKSMYNFHAWDEINDMTI